MCISAMLEDPDGQTSVARVGSEAVASNLEPGDSIQLEYLVGQVVKVSRVVPNKPGQQTWHRRQSRRA